MTLDLWLFVFGALGFVDGWLACWWISLITHKRQLQRDGGTE